jgi:hypothetical protein
MDESKKYFIKFLTRYPEVLKQSTDLDDNSFLKLDSDYLSKNKSRERFIYDVCLRIQQAGIFYIRMDDLINSSNDSEFNSSTGLNLAISLEKELMFLLKT